MLALFSTNETIDDVSTASIKFLAVDYYLGLLSIKTTVE